MTTQTESASTESASEFPQYRGRLFRINEVIADPNVPARSRATIYRWINDGRLRARTIGGSRMILGDSLAALLSGEPA